MGCKHWVPRLPQRTRVESFVDDGDRLVARVLLVVVVLQGGHALCRVEPLVEGDTMAGGTLRYEQNTRGQFGPFAADVL